MPADQAGGRLRQAHNAKLEFDLSWMRVFNRIAGYSENSLRKTKNPPVSLARKHFPRPMKEELLSAMSNSSFTSFLIARYKIQFKKP